MLSRVKIQIVVDERESAFYEKCIQLTSILNNPVTILKRRLDLGDILIEQIGGGGGSADSNDQDDDVPGPGPGPKVLCIIERKTLSDLMASIRDGRYNEQSFRLINSSNLPTHNIIYLLEGMMHAQLPKQDDKKKMYSALTSLLFFKGFSVLRTINLQESVDTVFGMVNKLQREIKKGNQLAFGERSPEDETMNASPTASASAAAAAAVSVHDYVDVIKMRKKENITKENIGEILLCQIPGISAVIAKVIMSPFESSFAKFLAALESNPCFLNELKVESNGKYRKLNRGVTDKIREFLLPFPPQQQPQPPIDSSEPAIDVPIVGGGGVAEKKKTKQPKKPKQPKAQDEEMERK